MKKIMLLLMILASLCICTSCHIFQKGQWVDGTCRPKEYNFKVLRTPFKETDELNFNKVYVVQDSTKARGFGFYPDGRFIFLRSYDGFAVKEKNVTGKTWDTAINIGYWRVDGTKIKVEYFICSDIGYYLEKEGEIKGDTLIFYQNLIGLSFKKIIKEQRYVLSDMEFGEVSKQVTPQNQQ